MNQVIIVTGASGHMGLAVVRQLLSSGHTVVGTVSPRKHSQPSVTHNRYEEFTLDVTDVKATAAFVEHVEHQYQRIDGAALLVGGFAMGNLTETSLQDVQKMLKLNFESAFIMSQAVYPRMHRQGGGHMVLVGAKPALEPAAGASAVAYALSKSLLFRLAEYINETGKAALIKASVMVPGILDTPPNREAMPQANFSDWVTPEEVAAYIDFLFSDKSKTLKGTVFKIYGKV